MKFSSARERRLWLLSLLVVLAIAISLFLSREIIHFLGDQNVRAVIFLSGMLLVGLAMILNLFQKNVSRLEFAVWVGMAAVFLMLFLRLGMAERSHVFEYSILTMLINQALLERKQNGFKVMNPALLTFLIAFGIGLLDELIQLIIPYRVFDFYDIIFNGMVILTTILSVVFFNWLKKKFR
ncbi:MAG: VanZ family protein [Flavobacteriaceae bacterium]|nr:VanZ family protein [Flavobacteriaceae bacterium]